MSESEDEDEVVEKLHTKIVPRIEHLWARLDPSQEDFRDLILKSFSQGLECI